MEIRLTPYEPNEGRGDKDWRGNEIVSGHLYHSIDFGDESYLVERCDIGDFYDYFGCSTDDGDWNIEGQPVLDSLLDEWVVKMWGRALQGFYY